MLTFDSLDDFRAMEGQDLGDTTWHVVDQGTVAAFADATGDRERIHLDQKAARAQGLDGTIAHGLLMLSLGPKFIQELYLVKGCSRVLNYGYEKVRFLAPVPTDSSIRMSARMDRVRDIDGGSAIHMSQTFELRLPDGTIAERPACVAEAVVAYFD